MKKLAYQAALLMCLSRPFAKIGFGGIYITEVICIILVFLFLFQNRSRRSWPELFLIGLVLYQVSCVLFLDLPRYSIDSVIRDSIIWLYPAAALFVASYQKIDLDEVFENFRKVITVWIYLYPFVFFFIYVAGPQNLEAFPFKKTDTASAFSLFILICYHKKRIPFVTLLVFIIDCFLVSTQGRSSLVIILLTCIAVFVLHYRRGGRIRVSKK